MSSVAVKYLGVPFVLHGRDRATGLDCLGLSLEVLSAYGHGLPDVRMDYKRDHPDGQQFEDYLKRAEERLEPIHPSLAGAGDLVAFDTHREGIANHFGVIVEGGLAITSFENTGAILVNLRRWRNRIKGVYRVRRSDPPNSD